MQSSDIQSEVYIVYAFFSLKQQNWHYIQPASCQKFRLNIPVDWARFGLVS